jgi:hypothetical protein
VSVPAVLPGATGKVGQAAAMVGFPDADAIVTNEESQAVRPDSYRKRAP